MQKLLLDTSCFDDESFDWWNWLGHNFAPFVKIICHFFILPFEFKSSKQSLLAHPFLYDRKYIITIIADWSFQSLGTKYNRSRNGCSKLSSSPRLHWIAPCWSPELCHLFFRSNKSLVKKKKKWIVLKVMIINLNNLFIIQLLSGLSNKSGFSFC